MNYKIHTCRWELIYLHEALTELVQVHIYNAKMHEKNTAILMHLHKMNNKLTNKLLKSMGDKNEPMELKLTYMDLVAIRMIGKDLQWADELLANEIKNKIYKILITI